MKKDIDLKAFAFTVALFGVLAVAADAAMINVTTSAPANATNIFPKYCAYSGTAFTFLAYSDTDATFNCSVYFASTNSLLAGNASTANGTSTTITGTVPSTSGQKTWYISCEDSATVLNATTLTAPVYLSSYSCYVNSSQGVGTTVTYLIKGGTQFVTAVIDKAMDSTMGVLEVGAITILLLLLGYGVASAGKGVRRLKSA